MGTQEFIYPKLFEDFTVSELVQADLANQCYMPQDAYKPDMTWRISEEQLAWRGFLTEQGVPLHAEGVAEATFKHLQQHPRDVVPEDQQFIWHDENPLHFMTPFVATLFVAVQVRRDKAARLGSDSLGNHPFRPTDEDFQIARGLRRGIISNS